MIAQSSKLSANSCQAILESSYTQGNQSVPLFAQKKGSLARFAPPTRLPAIQIFRKTNKLVVTPLTPSFSFLP